MSDILQLKYGCNPNQAPASLRAAEGALPIRILNGAPGYINFLDALNGWQLVQELKAALLMPAAASYKHTSPAGAAVGLPLTKTLHRMYFVGEEQALSPLCCAYIRARGADRLSSFGDFVALSDVCDTATASYLSSEVSDGIIAPGYEKEALEILRRKRKGSFTVLEIDSAYTPAEEEKRELFGITFSQKRNNAYIDAACLENIVTKADALPAEAKRDLLLALITLKYTQSNSVCYAKDGQTIGVGAGQQSRIHCTRLAANKADMWHLRQHPAVETLPFLKGLPRPSRDNAIDTFLLDDEWPFLLEGWQDVFSEKPAPLLPNAKRAWLEAHGGVSLASDAFFPFSDNIQRAARSGVAYIAQPGGSVRDDQVIAACDAYNITMAFTGQRLFYH